jgi:hypothetical protein
MRRVELSFAGLKIEFCDRERAIRQVEEFAERGTWHPVVVFGPEGCGKTSWLRQAVELLRELDFSVIYFNPMRKEFLAEVGIKSIEERVREVLVRASSADALASFMGYVIDFAVEVIRTGRKKLAMIVDDAFQYVKDKEVAFFVKGMLEVIEHPPGSYEKVVAIAATSEGFSRWEIGRHRWATIRPMWNMSKKGFEELYEKLPGPKPDFEVAWRLTGGNPEMLAKLYELKWDVSAVVGDLVKSRRLKDFVRKWGPRLRDVIEDPDSLLKGDLPEEFKDELIARNLIVYDMYDRDPVFWIDEPPPEKDLDLGIGREVAWQTPLHREAVKKAMEQSL